MKEKIRIFMLLLVLVGTMTAKSKKKSASRKRGGSTQHVVNATVAGLIPGVVNTTAVSSSTAMTDQQFLQEKLFGMQKNDIQSLKAKADDLKARNAENKKIIDQGLSQLLSGPVVMYKNN